jgi:AraC-like DNA-binding protein
MRARPIENDSCVVPPATELESAGHAPRTTPRPPNQPERVIVRQLTDLRGIEHWHVEASTRLWTLYHERYTFCVAHSCPGPQAWWYRRRTYRLNAFTSTMLIVPGEVHVTTQVPLASFHVLQVDPAIVQREFGEEARAVVRGFSSGQTDQPAVARHFLSLCRAIEDSDVDTFERRALLRQFFLAAFSVDCEERHKLVHSGCERSVMRVRDIVRSRLTDPLTLELLERETNTSKYYLERSFRTKMGVPIHRYLKLVRLQRAQELLRSGVLAIDVARQAGFFDSAHMCRTFKAELGFTPGAYARTVSR